MADRHDIDRSTDKSAPKRKGPIINQRGPSELSRAIEKMGILTGRPTAPKKGGKSPATRGTVVRLDRAKGYGFIVDTLGEQRFFHRTAVLDGGFDNLQEQQSVEFEPYADERGARAQKVRPSGVASRPESSTRSSKPSPKTSKASAWKSDLSPFRSGSGTPANTRRPKI